MKQRVCSIMKTKPSTTAYLLFASGPTVPTDEDTGYATGCIFQHTDGAAGTALYINEGDEDSCNFDAVALYTVAQDVFLGATAGLVTASKAIIVDASKDIGDFRNLDVVNLDAGVSGTAGTVDVFPATGNKGKFILACTDQDGATNVTLKPKAMGQGTVVSIPDPGAATAEVLLTDQDNDGGVVTATAAELNVLGGVTAGTVLAGGGVVVDSNKDVGDFRNLDAVSIDAGKDATAGTVDIFPASTGSGKFILACDDQDGATNVTLKPAPMAQASVISIPDPGAATANVVLTDQANDGAPVTATSAELNVLDGVIAGTVLASGGVVVDANKDVGDFRNLDAVNIDAGADAAAGTVDVFPTTGSRGKFTLSCDDQDGDTAVELKPAPMAQACVVSIPDPGAATANVMLTDQGNDGAPVTATSAELNVLDGVTAGTVLASGGVVADSNKDVGDFRNLDVVNLDAGVSGTAGTVDVFPSTSSRGKLILSCDDQDGDTNVTLKPAPMAQACVVSIPDPGASTANVMLTDQANDGAPITATSVELNVLDGVTAGTATASKGLVLNASGHVDAGTMVLEDMAEGTGISSATGEICEHRVTKIGGLFKTEILIDLTGLNDGGTANDIIGKDGEAANCHIGQITALKNGTIIAGRVTCFETPAGGNVDVDIYAATESNGVQDAAISGLVEAKLIDHGNWTAEDVDHLSALPAADKYLYLVCGASTDADYTGGILLIELWGV